QGAEHWQTANAKRDLQTLERIASLPAEAQAELTDATKLNAELFKLRQQGRYREGIPIAERIVAIRQRHLGEEHSDVANALPNHGFFMENAGEYTKAEPLYRRALAIRRKVLGEEHPYTAAACNNLAGVLHAQGKFREAQPLFRQALASYRNLLGEENSETAM